MWEIKQLLSFSKKYTAFTLAEVLITLLIIGVIAAIVVPNLINDSQDAELRAAFKKEFSSLSQAFIKSSQDNAGSLKDKYPNSLSVILDLANYMNISKTCNYGVVLGNCWHMTGDCHDNTGNICSLGADPEYSSMILNDGTFIKVYQRDPDCTLGETYSFLTGSNCAVLIVDINGFKKPNIVGKDVYRVTVDIKGVLHPVGLSTGSYYNQCGDGQSGWGCASWVLQGKDY